MINTILAALASGDIVIGGTSGLAAGSIVWWLTKRTLNKVLDHVDNAEIHIPKGEVYMREKSCLAKHEGQDKHLGDRHEEICREIREFKQVWQVDIVRVHSRLDETNKQLLDLLRTILGKVNKE